MIGREGGGRGEAPLTLPSLKFHCHPTQNLVSQNDIFELEGCNFGGGRRGGRVEIFY